MKKKQQILKSFIITIHHSHVDLVLKIDFTALYLAIKFNAVSGLPVVLLYHLKWNYIYLKTKITKIAKKTRQSCIETEFHMHAQECIFSTMPTWERCIKKLSLSPKRQLTLTSVSLVALDKFAEVEFCVAVAFCQNEMHFLN